MGICPKRGIHMPRPKVKGKVCTLPEIDLFGPLISNPNKREVLYLNIEEYETIRIIDLAGKSQEECATEMGIARTTLQRIYYSAKQKIADAIVGGKVLKIQGGNYKLCQKDIDCMRCKHCPYFESNC
jgi:predicted DNA-binding protein (UPF0251 family)